MSTKPASSQRRVERTLMMIAAPVAALLLAFVLGAIIIALTTDKSPWFVYRRMYEYGTTSTSMVSIVNRAVPMYISAVAVAIGFKMGLFNIGVEGQYRMAVLFAAWIGALVNLPPILHVTLIIAVAMAVGALWALPPAILKVKRGVHEVISTIMLNSIAIGVGAWLFAEVFAAADNTINPSTKQLPKSAWAPKLFQPHDADPITGWVVGAIIIGVLYYLLVQRTRFGYDLRSSGMNPTAAKVSGVDPNSMVVRSMLMSGAAAGLVGLPALMSEYHKYSNDLPTGYGFDGISVALVGRNHPVGMALAALLFGFIDRSALVLDLEGIAKEIIVILQAIIVLSVVVAYEVVKRVEERRIQRAAASAARDDSHPLAELTGAQA